MFRKFLLHVVFLVIAGYAVDLRAQGSIEQPSIFEINLKGCLDADPETAERDNCRTGQASPWTSCPTGWCESGRGDACKIPAQNINFSQWVHYTNAFYFNPPKAAPGATGKGAVEVDRTLCYYFRTCPCKQLPVGGNQCKMEEHVEEWLIKYERSNTVVCVGDVGVETP